MSEQKREWEQSISETERLKQALAFAEDEAKTYRNMYLALREEMDNLQGESELYREQYECISHSTIWKLTAPIRWVLELIKTPFRKIRAKNLISKFFVSLRRDGWRQTLRKVGRRLPRLLPTRASKLHEVPQETLAKQRETGFDREIQFSILVPLFNTPIPFLKEMIDSVVNQTYGNWELCLADGSDEKHPEVAQTVEEYCRADARIKYKKLLANEGISGNTNVCMEMATGNFIALFDHDDVLHPSALFEMMNAICGQNADFVYTDEAVFESPNIEKILTVHYKPDYAVDNLRANNYICHFSAFSAELLGRVGKFRSEFDGSQDHDLILRLTEAANKVVHVPKVLYFWRSHPLSVAQDINSKTYAILAGRRCVEAAVSRCGMKATVESSAAFPCIYRIRYDLSQEADEKISLVIYNPGDNACVERCLRSILILSSLQNCEIIVADARKEDESLSNFYAKPAEKFPLRVIYGSGEDSKPAALLNRAASLSQGNYLVFLNAAVELDSKAWLQELMMYAKREDVGAVGGLLTRPNKTVYHAGFIMNLGADHLIGSPFDRVSKESIGYMGRLCYSQDMSAVSAKLMMVKKELFFSVGGFDEDYFKLWYDADFCLRLRETGKLIVWTPYASACYYSRIEAKKKKGISEKHRADNDRFYQKWKQTLASGDPYYNPNFKDDFDSFIY